MAEVALMSETFRQSAPSATCRFHSISLATNRSPPLNEIRRLYRGELIRNPYRFDYLLQRYYIKLLFPISFLRNISSCLSFFCDNFLFYFRRFQSKRILIHSHLVEFDIRIEMFASVIDYFLFVFRVCINSEIYRIKALSF